MHKRQRVPGSGWAGQNTTRKSARDLDREPPYKSALAVSRWRAATCHKLALCAYTLSLCKAASMYIQPQLRRVSCGHEKPRSYRPC